MPFTHAVPFSLQQLEILAAWGEIRPFGLEVCIATDHEELDELAELFPSGQNYPSYCLTAISTGEIDVTDADGAVEVLPSLTLALEWIAKRMHSAIPQLSLSPSPSAGRAPG